MSEFQDYCCICVLGMHRSGTSALSGILQESGIPAGGVFQYNNDNIKGNREHPAIMKINQDLLELNQAAWDRPPLTTLQFTAELIQRRDQVLKGFSKYPLWMFKDPRTVLTFNFWNQAIPNKLFVCSFRHPLKVAWSLWRRNGMEILEGLKLWCSYNRIILDISEDWPIHFICFDFSEKLYKKKVRNLLGIIQKECEVGSFNLDIEKGLTFYKDSYKQNQNMIPEFCGYEIPDIWKQCERLYSRMIDLCGEEKVKIEKLERLLIPIFPDPLCLPKIAKQEPENTIVIEMLAKVYLDQGHRDQAWELYQKILRLNPSNTVVINYCLDLEEDPETQITMLQFAIEHNPEILKWYVRLSKVYRQIQQFEKAEQILHSALKVNPTYPQIYVQLIQLKRMLKKSEEAPPLLEKLKTLKPESPTVYIFSAGLQADQEKIKEAIEILHRGLSKYPQNANLYFTAANYFKKQGMSEAAKHHYQKAKEYNHPRIDLIEKRLASLPK